MLAKLYKMLWSRTTGRPFTYIIRDSWGKNKIFWFLGTLIAGVIFGHLFW